MTNVSLLKWLSCFNSIKVRLIRSSYPAATYMLFSFNSIKVRLIQKTWSFPKALRQFQFHKGSINTRSIVPPTPRHTSFQFHKGSINTVQQLSAQSSAHGFNSIKVRLILERPALCFDFRYQFQFHKGSINTKKQIIDDTEENQFQFHKGSINTV